MEGFLTEADAQLPLLRGLAPVCLPPAEIVQSYLPDRSTGSEGTMCHGFSLCGLGHSGGWAPGDGRTGENQIHFIMISTNWKVKALICISTLTPVWTFSRFRQIFVGCQ